MPNRRTGRRRKERQAKGMSLSELALTETELQNMKYDELETIALAYDIKNKGSKDSLIEQILDKQKTKNVQKIGKTVIAYANNPDQPHPPPETTITMDVERPEFNLGTTTIVALKGIQVKEITKKEEQDHAVTAEFDLGGKKKIELLVLPRHLESPN